ncbi:glycosyltransferase [Haloglomus litoreum]|uniref:glycosyltransferase n=1 Tax=Haloglomus litoreum TaxID=3034026 RepID=UPI0023E888B7|nr:glycosyltransferase [Haloglomus sp. DT116]
MICGIEYISLVAGTPSDREEDISRIKVLIERLNFKYLLSSESFCRTTEVKNILRSYDVDARILHGAVNKEDILAAIDGDSKNDIREKLGIPTEDRVLVFVGRLVALKRAQEAIRAFDSSNLDRLIIVGDGPDMENVEKEIERLGIQQQVRIAGWCEHKKAVQYIAAADGLIITSETESYPTVAFEAISLNTTVVSTPVGILSNLDSELLHTCSLEKMASKLDSEIINRTGCINIDSLDEYSIERYTSELLRAMKNA